MRTHPLVFPSRSFPPTIRSSSLAHRITLCNFSLGLKGFASLEAKRKFRAPWISPTTANPSALNSSFVNSLEEETLEANVSKTENSAAFIVSSENWGNGPHANNYVSCLTY